MATKANTQPATDVGTTDAPASLEAAPVGAVAVVPVTTPPRTPETVPAPGGGQYAWDEKTLDWVARHPKPAEPPAEAPAA